MPALRFHEVSLAPGAAQAAALEVALPGGNAAVVAELVRALRA
jgi:hypothetical protein